MAGEIAALQAKVKGTKKLATKERAAFQQAESGRVRTLETLKREVGRVQRLGTREPSTFALPFRSLRLTGPCDDGAVSGCGRRARARRATRRARPTPLFELRNLALELVDVVVAVERIALEQVLNRLAKHCYAHV